MNLPKKDRSLVRTAKDIERKYNLGGVSEIDRELRGKIETIAGLEKKSEELDAKYNLLEDKVTEQNEKLDLINLEDYYRKEEIDEKIGDIESLLAEI